jgi:hypothetical protein
MPKISELTSVTSIAGNETIPVVQSATTKKATASQLKGYRSYTALFTYDSLNSEINITDLNNDDFSIISSRISAGIYNLEDSTGPFLEGKTFLIINQDNNLDGGGEGNYIMNVMWRFNDENIRIKVLDVDLSTPGVTNTDNIRNCSIEIRVYP